MGDWAICCQIGVVAKQPGNSQETALVRCAVGKPRIVLANAMLRLAWVNAIAHRTPTAARTLRTLREHPKQHVSTF